MKMLLSSGSLTSDPMNTKRYIVFDDENPCTGSCETILVGVDYKEIKLYGEL